MNGLDKKFFYEARMKKEKKKRSVILGIFRTQSLGNKWFSSKEKIGQKRSKNHHKYLLIIFNQKIKNK